MKIKIYLSGDLCVHDFPEKICEGIEAEYSIFEYHRMEENMSNMEFNDERNMRVGAIRQANEPKIIHFLSPKFNVIYNGGHVTKQAKDAYFSFIKNPKVP